MARVANAMQMATQGELNPGGILVAASESKLVGAVLATPLAGAVGLIWPPQVVSSTAKNALEAELVREALRWLSGGGAKLVQCVLHPEEAKRAEPLMQQGFRRVTHLWYMHHDLTTLRSTGGSVEFQPSTEVDSAVFAQTLGRTYVDSLDCPEVNGARSIDDALASHRAQGRWDPSLWWLATRNRAPVGVAIVAPMTDAWDLAYMGVVPEARGRGMGSTIVAHALASARNGSAPRLTLAVDGRNVVAMKMYTTLGFVLDERREIYLWKPGGC